MPRLEPVTGLADMGGTDVAGAAVCCPLDLFSDVVSMPIPIDPAQFVANLSL
jgi:hypothetical protein